MALKLVFLGLVAGLFSALFGVGGGIVIVPLLILMLGFESRVATGTSLAAIGITALAGTILYAFEGHVDVAHAALVGLPAAAGAIVGTGVQQRVSRPQPDARLRRRSSWRSQSGCSSDERRHGRLRRQPRLRRRAARGLLRRRRRDPVRADPRRARARRSSTRRRRRCWRSCRPSPPGTWRQRHYGNVRWRTALVLGVTSIAGAAVGVQIATALPEDVLRRLFAVLLLGVAAQLAWRSRRTAPYPSEP